MIEDLQLRGLSESTQIAYVRVVRQLAEYYGKSPERISEEEVRQYFLYLRMTGRSPPTQLASPVPVSSFCMCIPSGEGGGRWTWCAPHGKESYLWSSVSTRCTRYWRIFVSHAIEFV